MAAALWLLCGAGAWAAGQVQGTVTDPAGQPLAARVLVLNPVTRDSDLVYTGPDGAFTANAPDGDLVVTVSRGPEWTRAEVPAQGGQTLQVVLQRLVDMPARGWYGTDFHMHSTVSDGKQTPTQVAAICQAEGLQVAALTDHAQVAQQPEWLAQKSDQFLPLPGEEISTALGHIVGVNITKLVSTDTSQGRADLERIFREVHEQGGFAIVAHPNIPSMTYRHPDLVAYEALEILNGSVPPYGPPFDFVQGRKAWHAALSTGRQVAVVGNSDNHDGLGTLARQLLRNPEQAVQIDKRAGMLMKMVDVEKVMMPWGWKGLHNGTYRTYLQLAEFTPAGVAVAVQAGRGFVTNGPLLPATLDGAVMGSEITLGDRQTLTFAAEPLANRPLERLDLIVSGQVVVSLKNPAGQVNVPLPVKRGDWVTAELYGPWPEFATTNAWYVR